MRERPLRRVVGLALFAAWGCRESQVQPPVAHAGASSATSPVAGGAWADATPADLRVAVDYGSTVHTLYTEAAPFTNKTTVEVVDVSPACHHALVAVVYAPPGPTAVPTATLALDAIDIERGALLERWIASGAAALYFLRYDDVEGGRPLAPPSGFDHTSSARCDDAHAASIAGAVLERAVARDERHMVDSDGAPEVVAWRRWMRSARDGVPTRIDASDLAAMETAADTAGWTSDRRHLYLSGRWGQSGCLYDLAIDEGADVTKATRRSWCSTAKGQVETHYALSPARRSAVRLTTSDDAPAALYYTLLDLAGARTCKKGRLDVGPTDGWVEPALSDEGLLWLARETPLPPLVVDLVTGRVAAVESPPRVGRRGALYAGMPAGPGVARSAAVLWMDGGQALTTRVSDDGKTAVVLVNALALLSEARNGGSDAPCAP
jgi:hypothetical protein